MKHRSPRNSCALVLVVGFVLAAHAWAQDVIPGFAAKELGLQHGSPEDVDFERPFEAPLPARIADAQGKRLIKLNNCLELLAVRERIVGSDNDANFRVLRLEAVPCVALALLKSSAAANRTSLPGDFLQEITTSSYPASLWPAVSDDERQQSAAPGATLATVSGQPVLHALDGVTLELEAAGIVVHLTLLARGDFDHDGWEDAAFRWEAYSTKGSYSDARLIVLTRTEANAGLHELALDLLLAPDRKNP
jgi:hypothetical protein